MNPGAADRRLRLIEGPVVREWMDHAACLGHDIEVFFPGKGTDSAKPAKRICAVCPVRQECLDYAVDNHEQFGVFGGMVREERRAYARRRRAS